MNRELWSSGWWHEQQECCFIGPWTLETMRDKALQNGGILDAKTLRKLGPSPGPGHWHVTMYCYVRGVDECSS